MRFARVFSTIDTHTVGQPTRTVIGGLPHIPGDTVADKMLHLRDHMDWIRTMLTYEPRGSGIMSGAIITPPCHPEADLGIIYIEVGGYLPMCGHDTIGATTALIEGGIIPAVEPETTLTLETPAGLVRVTAEVRDHVVKSVRFRNVPAFLYKKDVSVPVPGLGEVSCDIAYGGNFYAILPADSVGLRIDPANAGSLIQAGNKIREAINSSVEVQHPEKPFVRGLTHVEFYGPPCHPEAHVQNCVVFQPGGIDRSPCGTGTCAKVATLCARGELDLSQEFVHESIIGTTFRARAIEETAVGQHRAVIVEIRGQAFVTGMHTFVRDPEDPLPDGFLLGV